MRKPNLFIIGVAKAGTTSLHDALAQHPDVFMSTPKEPHYFARIAVAGPAAHVFNRVQQQDKYLALFSAATEQIVGESSTSYWWDQHAAQRITGFSSRARVVISLRDPVQRAYSHYLNDVRDMVEDRSFDQTLPSERPGCAALRWGDSLLRTELGFYAERLRYYLDVFGDRAHVLIFEDFKRDPEAVLANLFGFLELPIGPARQSLGYVTQSVGTDAVANPHRMPKGRAARAL